MIIIRFALFDYCLIPSAKMYCTVLFGPLFHFSIVYWHTERNTGQEAMLLDHPSAVLCMGVRVLKFSRQESPRYHYLYELSLGIPCLQSGLGLQLHPRILSCSCDLPVQRQRTRLYLARLNQVRHVPGFSKRKSVPRLPGRPHGVVGDADHEGPERPDFHCR